MAQSLVVSQEEMDKQRQCAARVREGFPGRTYKIVTYGCQMNAHDSENLAGMLEEMGFAPAADEGEADLLLFNTCCIRDNAERRLLGNVSALAQRKREKPDLFVGVCGCMMQQEGGAQRLLDLCPFVDLVFGTHNLYRLPELLLRALRGQPVRETDGDERGCIPEGLPVRRTSAIQGALTIMYGCNNFCTYCVVPYVRGRERSRSVADVVREAESMAASGIQEILLLGQNVNSYAGGATFPELLRALDGVVPRIRFMTSHPKDLSDALIEEMARSRSVCPQFHLPVQSGNDKVLREMNRATRGRTTWSACAPCARRFRRWALRPTSSRASPGRRRRNLRTRSPWSRRCSTTRPSPSSIPRAGERARPRGRTRSPRPCSTSGSTGSSASRSGPRHRALPSRWAPCRRSSSRGHRAGGRDSSPGARAAA